MRTASILSAVALLAFVCSARPAAGEPGKVACPVPKPQATPRELRATFSADAGVRFEDQCKELEALSDRARDEECADALRWLVHQPEFKEELRERAFQVLCDWGYPWLFDDVVGMVEDAAQPQSWRARSVKLIGKLSASFPAWDQKTYEGLVKYSAPDAAPFLRDAALVALAQLARDYHWRLNAPERYDLVSKRVNYGLGEARAEGSVAALRAAALIEAVALAAEVEKLAADAAQAEQVRRAALGALKDVARPESLAVLDALAGTASLAPLLTEVRPYVLVAQLDSPSLVVRDKAFKELAGIGAPAGAALERAALGEEGRRQRLARTLLGDMLAAHAGLKPVDRQGLKRFGENPAKKKEGLPTLLWDMDRKLILAEADFPLEAGALEYVAVCRGENAKLHETVVALHCSPTNICLALLGCGYAFVGELRQGEKIVLPKDAGVMLSVEWEREREAPEGINRTPLRLPVEAFAWNTDTGAPMRRAPWAFTGSRWVQGDDGRQFLRAEIEKSLAAIMPDPDAILNTMLDSASDANVGANRQGFYVVNRFIIPKKGTACWLVFEPWAGGELKPQDVHDKTASKAALGQ